MSRVLTIQPGEDALFDFDMSPYINRAGDDITAVNSVTFDPVGPTNGAPGFSGQLVQMTIANASDGVNYNIVIDFTTTNNPSLRPDFTLTGKERKG